MGPGMGFQWVHGGAGPLGMSIQDGRAGAAPWVDAAPVWAGGGEAAAAAGALGAEAAVQAAAAVVAVGGAGESLR